MPGVHLAEGGPHLADVRGHVKTQLACQGPQMPKLRLSPAVATAQHVEW
jgi:hypothetical protein